MIGKLNLYFYLMILLLINIEKTYAQSPDYLMRLGNKYYQEQKYEEAIDTYKKILSKGYESSALYYNLGNTYFRLGKLGYAILNYEKALKLSPGDEDVNYNLKIANARTVDRITELPKLFIVQWWEILITSLSLNNWALLTIVFYILLLSCIGIYLLSRKVSLQKFAYYTGIISIVIFLFTSAILISRYNYEKTRNYGILLEPSYTVKVAPDYRSNDAFVIHEGIKFIVEDHVNNWSKIRLADGKVGWLPDKVFEKI